MVRGTAGCGSHRARARLVQNNPLPGAAFLAVAGLAVVLWAVLEGTFPDRARHHVTLLWIGLRCSPRCCAFHPAVPRWLSDTGRRGHRGGGAPCAQPARGFRRAVGPGGYRFVQRIPGRLARHLAQPRRRWRQPRACDDGSDRGLHRGVRLLGDPERTREFYFLCYLAGGITGAFVSLDIFFLYFFHELALVPTFIMIGVWGRGDGGRSRLSASLPHPGRWSP